MSDGSLAWADYDSDGFADLLVMGLAGSTPVAKVFRGDGAGGLAEVAAGLTGLWRGSAAWGDYDNDGRMDVGHGRLHQRGLHQPRHKALSQ